MTLDFRLGAEAGWAGLDFLQTIPFAWTLTLVPFPSLGRHGGMACPGTHSSTGSRHVPLLGSCPTDLHNPHNNLWGMSYDQSCFKDDKTKEPWNASLDS